MDCSGWATLNQVLQIAEYVFTGLFTLEMVVKIVARVRVAKIPRMALRFVHLRASHLFISDHPLPLSSYSFMPEYGALVANTVACELGRGAGCSQSYVSMGFRG